MDVHELTLTPVATTWSLRGTPDLLLPAAPWWPEGVQERPAGNEGAAATASGRRPRGALRIAAGLASAAAIVLVAAAAVALLGGMRWFVVETPSMGATAPVGSLVITEPVPGAPARGTVIAFVPPGNARVYTHRVIAVGADGGIRTKGDINAAPDPWTVSRSAVLGRAVAILPGAGYLVRGVPGLIAGAMLLWAATLLIRRRDQRAAARVIGLHVVATVVVLWLHPFVRVVLLATESAADGVRASMVSTGLLPVRLVDSAGTVLARLSTGHPEVVALPATATARGQVLAVPDLGPVLQGALVAAALVPALVVFLVGLPRREEASA